MAEALILAFTVGIIVMLMRSIVLASKNKNPRDATLGIFAYKRDDA